MLGNFYYGQKVGTSWLIQITFEILNLKFFRFETLANLKKNAVNFVFYYKFE